MSASSYCILGAGLAGVLIARELLEQGIPATSITICAPHSGSKASDVPGALMHPLPGTTLDPKPDTMLAYEHAVRRLLAWHERYPEHVLETSMIRPDRGGRKGKRFVKTYLKGAASYHADMHHELLSGQEAIEEVVTGLRDDTQRAVRYGPTYCTAPGALLPLLLADLLKEGINHLPYHIDFIKQSARSKWSLHSDDIAEPVAQATHVFLAMGSSLRLWFPELDVHLNGGELAVLEAASGVELACMISGGGHISPMPACEPGRWVMGSTYLRPEEGLGEEDEGAFWRSDEEAITQLREMIGSFYPAVHTAPMTRIWRGRRVVYTPDKHPLVGPHPEHEGVYILGALGSKGLLWAPLMAHQLVRLMCDGGVSRLSQPCDAARAPKMAWRSPKILTS